MVKPPKHSLRSLIINVILVVVAFGLLGAVVWNKRDKIHEIFSRNLDLRLVALAFGVYLTAMVLTFVRWYWLVRVIEPSFRLRDAFLLGFIGNVFNLVIPGAVGGDLIKAAYLVRMQINKTQAIASMVLDRLLGLLGLFSLAAISGVLAWSVADVSVKRLIVIVWCFLVIGFLGLWAIFAQSLTRRAPWLLEGHGRVALILRELKSMSETYRRRLEVVAGALVLAAVNHALNVLAFYLVSRTIFPNGLPSLAQHYLIVPLTLFTTAAPIPFGALGLTEQVSEQLWKLASHSDGDLAMMGFRVLMYAGALVSASIYLLNLQRVRGLTASAEHLEEELLEGELDPEPGSDLDEDAPPVEPEAE